MGDPPAAELRLKTSAAGVPAGTRPKKIPVRGLLGLICATWSGAALAATGITLEFIGEQILATGAQFEGSTIGGLSGIDYDPTRDVYYVISDARGDRARFYTVTLKFDRDGITTLRFEGTTRLTDAAGRAFGAAGNTGRPDPEALRWNPRRLELYWSSEGDGSAAINPQVRAARLTGETLRQYPVPDRFRRTAPGRGVRVNRSLESLALSVDAKTLYTANESALRQDGAPATSRSGTPVRIVAYDVSSAARVAEYAYRVDPVANVPPGHTGTRENGLVELLGYGPGRLLALERAYIAGVGNFASIHAVDLPNASDVSSIRSLRAPGTWRPLRKTLVARLQDYAADIRAARAGTRFADERRVLDNLEGMTLGPELDGAPTIVLVSDNNFGLFGPQFTQFLVFRIVAAREVSEPRSVGARVRR